MKVNLTHVDIVLIGGGESIDDGDCDDGGGGGGEDVYRDKAKPVLVSVSDLYSKDNSISVCDSKPSSSPAYTTTDYLRLLTTALKEM